MGGLLEGMGVPGEGAKGENWDGCNSMINKVYFKKINKIQQMSKPEESTQNCTDTTFKYAWEYGMLFFSPE